MSPLPFEMSVLVWLTLLAASLWIPYVIGVNMYRDGEANPFQRPLGDAGLPDWVARANRAHLNLIEQGLPFAILVLVLHVTDGFTQLTAWTALVFLVLRLAHAIGMISGFAQMPLRPIIFTTGWICCVILGISALM